MQHRTSSATSATLPLQLCHVVITPRGTYLCRPTAGRTLRASLVVIVLAHRLQQQSERGGGRDRERVCVCMCTYISTPTRDYTYTPMHHISPSALRMGGCMHRDGWQRGHMCPCVRHFFHPCVRVRIICAWICTAACIGRTVSARVHVRILPEHLYKCTCSRAAMSSFLIKSFPSAGTMSFT